MQECTVPIIIKISDSIATRHVESFCFQERVEEVPSPDLNRSEVFAVLMALKNLALRVNEAAMKKPFSEARIVKAY
jgi:hypothetical protein